ncbi:LysR family transcriptional regulator [Silvibacterium dinghuense]|nr:LysR family transcriptional regulator [Silvibacterium dinghuense]GGG98043.1 LysR family transcriptional regulator [Silvibacterium dinghuense]
MRPVHLRNLDLNLLMPLYALLKERSVTRAAQQVNLSQPAMSRAFERLREVLGDELLVGRRGRYELTARGSTLLRELELLLPRLERLWAGERFSPRHSMERVRLSMTDFAASLLLPRLMLVLAERAPGLRIEVAPPREGSFEDASAGRVDFIFSPLAAPSALRVEVLFEEDFVCLVAKAHPFAGKQFGLREYLAQGHIVIDTENGRQTLVDRPLAEAGHHRRSVLQVPFFVSGALALEGTRLVLTVPRRLATLAARHARVRTIEPPKEIRGFSYAMSWHPRLEQEPLHAWFREQVREICADL